MPVLEQFDRHAAGEVVVASSGLAHGIVLRAWSSAQMTGPRRDGDERLHGVSHVVISKLEIPASALLSAYDQSARPELRQMSAGR